MLGLEQVQAANQTEIERFRKVKQERAKRTIAKQRILAARAKENGSEQ